jgi:hypothetical protein
MKNLWLRIILFLQAMTCLCARSRTQRFQTASPLNGLLYTSDLRGLSHRQRPESFYREPFFNRSGLTSLERDPVDRNSLPRKLASGSRHSKRLLPARRIRVSQADIPLISRHIGRSRRLISPKRRTRIPRSLVVNHRHESRRRHSRHGRRHGHHRRHNRRSRRLRSRRSYKFKEVLTDGNMKTLSMMMEKINALKNLTHKTAPSENPTVQNNNETPAVENPKANRRLAVKRPRHKMPVGDLNVIRKRHQLKNSSIMI